MREDLLLHRGTARKCVYTYRAIAQIHTTPGRERKSDDSDGSRRPRAGKGGAVPFPTMDTRAGPRFCNG